MDPVLDNLDLYWSGFLRSLGMCLWGLVGSLILGTVIAAFRVSPVPALRGFGTAWVTFIRNCPLTVVLFFMAFGIPALGINASYYFFGMTALIIYTSPFVCEAIRSGINAVPVGQAEAARAIGLGFTQTLREVILPQAMRSAIPPLGSVMIAMFKNSALVGAFGVGGDLWAVAKDLSSAQGYPALPVFTGAAIGYLCITIPAALFLMYLEKKAAIVR